MIVMADLHMGKVQDTITKEGYPSRTIDVYDRLKEGIKVAYKLKEDFVLAGDIFDSTTPSPWMIDLFMEAMVVASGVGVRVVIIPGNHDCGVQFNSLMYIGKVAPTVVFVDMPTIVNIDKDVCALMLPHVSRQAMEKMVTEHGSYAGYVQNMLSTQNVSIVNYIIGHAHVTGAKNTSDIEIEAGDALRFDTKDYPKFTRAVFGHIHKPQTLKKDRILYTGSVVTNSFDEAEIEKGMVHIWERGEKFEFLPFKTPVTEYKHVVIDLVSKDDVELDPVKIDQLVKNKLIKISVYARDPMQIDMQGIRAAFDVAGKVVRFETVITHDIAEIDQGLIDDDLFGEVDFLKVFKSWIDMKETTPKVKRLAITLAGEIIEEVADAERAVS